MTREVNYWHGAIACNEYNDFFIHQHKLRRECSSQGDACGTALSDFSYSSYSLV
jgi:hypothetical protein